MEALRWQESIGLKVVTDGEFRRESWRLGFVQKVQGFTRAPAIGEVDLKGTGMTFAEQEAKLRLVVDTAREVWGDS